MGVTTRSLYGLRLVVYLLKKGGSATVKEVAEMENVPYRYMERIVQDMRKADILSSRRGRGGGITLVNPKKITLKEIIHALDGKLINIPCIPFEDGKGCTRAVDCEARVVWLKLIEQIDSLCGGININTILRRKHG